MSELLQQDQAALANTEQTSDFAAEVAAAAGTNKA